MNSVSTLHLDNAGVTDLGGVMCVMREAFDPLFGEAWTEPQCAGLLSLPGSWLVLLHEGAEPAGFAMARVTFDEAELLLIGVRPAFRRRGIGTRLIAAVIAEARDRGLARLHLEARDGNEATALYQTLGFRQVGRRRAYYHGTDGTMRDALTLQRSL